MADFVHATDRGRGTEGDIAVDGTVKIGLDGEDWFGPGRPSLPPRVGEPVMAIDQLGAASSVTVVEGDVRCSVRAYVDRPLLVFRCEATTDLTDITTGEFDRPSLGWPTFTPSERAQGETPKGLRALVFQHCEFALPSNAGPSLDGWFLLLIVPRLAGPCCSPEKTAGRFSLLPSTRSTSRPSA